jgi:hypothetical protein
MNYDLRHFLLEDVAQSEVEKLRLIAIGSHEGVTETIHSLYRLRYSDVTAWSPILLIPDSTYAMSILTRHRQRGR